MRKKISLVSLFFLTLVLFFKPKIIKATEANLISNPSVETASSSLSLPQDWYQGKWGSNTVVFSYPVSGFDGTKAIKVEMKKRISGDAKWYFKDVPVKPGEKYIFSDYYTSNITSYITVRITYANGSYGYSDLVILPSSPNWTKKTASYTIPQNSVSLTIFHLINKVGWLITDNFSLTLDTPIPVVPTSTPTPTPTNTPVPTSTPTLTPTNTPTPTPVSTSTPTPTATPLPNQNLIANPSVETSSTTRTTPKNWSTDKWGTNTNKFTYPVAGFNSKKAVKVEITKYTNGDAKWYFDYLPVNPGDTYNFSDWYQSNVESQVVVHFLNTDGTDYFLGLKNATASAGWAYYSESFQVPFKAKTMTVLHLLSKVGWLITDNFSLSKIIPAGFNSPLFTLTFDDGWEDNGLTALPILKSYGFHGTFFFATTYLENSPVTGPINVSGPMAVKAFYDEGNEIGSHSVTHPDLTLVSQSELTNELSNSKKYLESLVGAGEIKNFASPYGAYNNTVINAIKLLYRSHRPTDEGYNTQENLDLYRLKVQNMKSTTTLAEYQSWVNQAIKDKSWLILVYHRVASDTLGEWDTHLTDFQQQMNFVKNSGIKVLTLEQALNEVLGITITPTATPLPTSTPAPTTTPIPEGNLVANPSLEISEASEPRPQDWFMGNNWGNNTVSYTYPVAGFNSEKAAKVEITQYVGGDSKWYFKDVNVEPGQTYTFSDNYQSNVDTLLVVRYLKQGTTDQYTYAEFIPVNASTSWTTKEIQLTIPTGIQSLSIFHLVNQVGYLIIDNISLTKNPDYRLSSGIVSLDFDDGWLSAYSNGLPILTAAGLKGTQYIATGFLGTTGYISSDQVSALQASGQEVGAHSKSHTDLTTLTEAQITDEVLGSKNILAGMGVNSSSFAYPFGEYNSTIEAIVKQSGFTAARTAKTEDSGLNFKNTDRFLLKTQSVETTTSIDQVKAWINEAVAQKGWLILVFHQVDNSGEQYSVTPETLQQIVNYLKEQNISVVTVSEGLQQISN